MQDYHGTSGADTLNQTQLSGFTPGSVIYGEDGDDFIVATNALVMGGAGNDTIIGTDATTLIYWESPRGVLVNLATGVAQDGYGSTDTFSGIHVLHGSWFNDTLLGSAADDSFHGNGGNNLITGGGGNDQVRYFFVRSTDATITYDAAQDAVSVSKHFANGDNGTDTLKGISTIMFEGSGSDNRLILVSSLKASAFKVSQGTSYAAADAGSNPRWAVGDYNGDGEQDIILRYDPESSYSATVTGTSPLRFFAGSGAAGLAQDLAFLNPGTSPTNVAKIVTADLNGDGRPDVIVAASGQDPYVNGQPMGPTPGETSYVLLSNGARLGNVTVSGALPIFGHHASVGDINNDGFADVFIDSISTNPSYFIMGGASGAVTADYSRLSSGISNYRFTITSTFPSGDWKTQTSATGTATALIDANKDGWLDLAILPQDGTPVGVVYLNDRTGHFNESSRIILPAGPFGAGSQSRETPGGPIYSSGTIYLDTAVVDINGDGRDDLISVVTNSQQTPSKFVYYQGARIQVLISNGNGFVDDSNRVSFNYAPTDNYTHYYALRADDINADGFRDIILYRNATVGPNAILLNDGTGRYSEVAYPAGLPDGNLVVLDAAKGEYAILHSAKDGTTGANGFANYVQRVDKAYFDWSKGLDFFTGAMDGRGAALQSDIPGRWVHGTSVDNTILLSTGDERAWGYGGNDTINGGAGADTIDGGEGSNYLRGEAGEDSLSGGSGFDDMHGNMGNDTLHGNDGEDWVVGGKDNDLLFGDAAWDIVYGNMGNDTVEGGAGNDWVRGGQGDDSVMGGAGDDWIWGDKGNDTISGGAGADIFHSLVGAAIDRITDFNYAQGDRLVLDGGPTRTINQVGANVVVDMGNGDQVILVGVSLSSLGSGWID